MSDSQLADEQPENSSARTELDQELKLAAEALLFDYLHDRELTAFHILDGDEFYFAD